MTTTSAATTDYVELLRGAGHVTEEQARDLRAWGFDTGQMASVVVANGWATERAIAQSLATFERTVAVSLAESTIDLAPLALLPEDIAVEHRLLPVAMDAASITMATSSQEPAALVRRMSALTGRQVILLRAVDCVLEKLTPHAYTVREHGETRIRGRLSTSNTPMLTTLKPTNAASNLELAGLINTLTDSFSALRAVARAEAPPPGAAPRPSASTSTSTSSSSSLVAPAPPPSLSSSTSPRPATGTFTRTSTGTFPSPSSPPAPSSTRPRPATGTFARTPTGTFPSPSSPPAPSSSASSSSPRPATGSFARSATGSFTGLSSSSSSSGEGRAPGPALPRTTTNPGGRAISGTGASSASTSGEGRAVGASLPRTTTSPGARSTSSMGAPYPATQPPTSTRVPLRKGRSVGVDASPANVAAPSPSVLLAVADTALQRQLVALLRADGCTVLEASDGAAALLVLRAVKPAVIVVDAALPGVQGVEIAAGVRQSPDFADVAVVVIDEPSLEWQRSFTVQEVHGADDWLTKPVSPEIVHSVVAQYLGTTLPRLPRPLDRRAEMEKLKGDAAWQRLMGEWSDALQAVDAWLAVDPFSGEALVARGTLLQTKERMAEALRDYELATIYEPGLYEAWVSLAMHYDRLGFQRKAEVAWKNAEELSVDGATRQKILERVKR